MKSFASNILPNALNLPRTFRLMRADAPVETVCFFESMYKSKSACGVVRKRTLCWIMGVIGPPARRESHALKQVPHLTLFGLEIGARNPRNARLAGNSLDDADTRRFQLFHLIRVV